MHPFREHLGARHEHNGSVRPCIEGHGRVAGSSLNGDKNDIGLIPIRHAFIGQWIGNQKHISFAVGRVGVTNKVKEYETGPPPGISNRAQAEIGHQLKRLTIPVGIALGDLGHIQARNGLADWGRIIEGAHGRQDVRGRRNNRKVVNPNLDGTMDILRRIDVKTDVYTVDRVGNGQYAVYRTGKMLPSGGVLDLAATSEWCPTGPLAQLRQTTPTPP